jgi:hypothetical protein
MKRKKRKMKKALASARATAKTKKSAKMKPTRKKKAAQNRAVTLCYSLRYDGDPLTAEFTSGPKSPGRYPTRDLTIDLGHHTRWVTISLVGTVNTFASPPISIAPFDGNGTVYETPDHPTAPGLLSFHVAKLRTKHRKEMVDKYTLYFGDGSLLDPSIQNPGGNPYC